MQYDVRVNVLFLPWPGRQFKRYVLVMERVIGEAVKGALSNTKLSQGEGSRSNTKLSQKEIQIKKLQSPELDSGGGKRLRIESSRVHQLS